MAPPFFFFRCSFFLLPFLLTLASTLCSFLAGVCDVAEVGVLTRLSQARVAAVPAHPRGGVRAVPAQPQGRVRAVPAQPRGRVRAVHVIVVVVVGGEGEQVAPGTTCALNSYRRVS